MERVLIIIAIILCCIFIIILLLSFVIFCLAFVQSNYLEKKTFVFEKLKPYQQQIDEGIKWFLAQDYQNISLKSFDNLTLAGKFLKNPASVGTIILMHGHRGSSLRDFSSIFEFYYNLGYNILIPDQRAHGKSQGKFITWGIKEKHDCLAWINYINKELDDTLPIFLDGISMGASTVLMTLGLTLPRNVKGVIADCGFTSPYQLIKKILNSLFFPPFTVLFLVNFYARVFIGIDIRETTIEALKNGKIPVLFIHGADDKLIPSWMSVDNFNSYSNKKELYIIDNADHGMSYLVEQEKCNILLTKFLKKYH